MQIEKSGRDLFTGKMFLRQIVPAFVSAAGLALGDMADAVVLGRRMGVVGLASISLALPVFMVINTLMHALGIGGSIRFSRLLAEGRREDAARDFQGVMAVALIVSCALALVGNLLLTPLLSILGTVAADGALYEATRDYVQVILAGMPLFFLSYILNYYLRNDDAEKLASLGFTTGNLSDIALNIVFVLAMGMGTAGAAWATLCGQMISIAFYIPGVMRKSGNLRVFPIRPDVRNVFSCFRLGFTSSAQYLFSMCFLALANNALMRISSSTGVAVFDMVQNASFLILYLYDGASKAAQPLVSTYSGERNTAARRHTLRLSLCWGAAAGILVAAAVAIFPETVCRIFGLTEPAAMRMGVYALRVFCAGTVFAGTGVVLEGYYQACDDEKIAFVLAFLRGAAVLIPITMLFSALGPSAFWWLFPVTEGLSLGLFLLCFRRGKRGEAEAGRVYTRIIQSKDEELSPLLSEIDAFCERWDASPRQRYFVAMAAEELCSAIMHKGFRGGEGYLQVTLIAQEDGLFALHIRDNAVSFNPFSLETDRAVVDGDFDMDAIGILVIREKAKEFFYRHYQGFNTLSVKI